ncbi:MAG TPA: hypothetical protein VL334_16505 [Anaerolineae bacterium]|nr:hypothetical protein [Anaerolineae bacterium]
MKTVMGLFEQRNSAEAAAAAAQKAGVPQHQITLMNNATPASQLVEPGPRSITMKSVRGFTLMLTAIFVLFGLFAGIGSIYVFQASAGIAALTVLVFLLIGLFCGLFMGWVMGRSEADTAIQEFREAVEHGDTLLVVETEKYAKVVEAKMRAGNAHWVITTQQVNPIQTYPELHEMGHAPAAAH